jgi:hypothetical protein
MFDLLEPKRGTSEVVSGIKLKQIASCVGSFFATAVFSESIFRLKENFQFAGMHA